MEREGTRTALANASCELQVQMFRRHDGAVPGNSEEYEAHVEFGGQNPVSPTHADFLPSHSECDVTRLLDASHVQF
jgi:hypothetical protein